MSAAEAARPGDGRDHRRDRRASRWCCSRSSCRSPSSPASRGQLFQQFAVAVSVSMVLSAINALTLSPALCAILLKPHHGPKRGAARLDLAADRRRPRRLRRGSPAPSPGGRSSASCSSPSPSALTAWLFRVVPTGFLPDRGPGRLLHRGPAARGRLGQPHRRGACARSRRCSAGIDGVGERRHRHRLQLPRRARQVELRLRHRQHAALRRAHRPGRSRSSPRSQRAMRAGRTPSARRRSSPSTCRRSSASAPARASSTSCSTCEGRAPAELAARRRRADRRRQPGPAARARPSPPSRPARRSSTSTSTASGCRPSASRSATSSPRCRARSADLRQRLQPLRPHLAGEHAGAPRPTAPRSPTSTACTCATPPARWCRSARWRGVEFVVGPQSIVRYNNFRSVTLNGAPAPGVASGDGAGRRWRRSAPRRCRPATASSGPAPRCRRLEAAGQTTTILALALVFAYLFLVGLYESWTIPVPVLLSVAVGVAGALAVAAARRARRSTSTPRSASWS